MNTLNDPVKILARRFVSLPLQIRMKVAGRLLSWRERIEASKDGGKRQVYCRCAPEKSFLEQFWDEVEAAHNDGLYPINPFAEETPGLIFRGVGNSREQYPAHFPC